MIHLIKLIFSLIISYLLGSLPTAYIFGRLYKKIDIREHGSGNMGATNAFRVLGKIPGILVLLIDIAKGTIATTLIADLFGLNHVIDRVLLGIIVVIGHNWTVFLNFKGGKGIATSLGVLIGLTIKISFIRPVLGIAILTWIVVFLMTGFVSLASIVSASILPVVMVYFNEPFEIIVLGIIFCILVVVRHRPNIKRILNGKESRVHLPFHRKRTS